jgi:diguanylate cyclase (GGDEF)-like protein
MEVLDGIKLYLGAEFYSKLNIISQRVNVSENLNELDSITSDILHLIVDYITNLNEEIENMALFITDVGRNLFEVEDNIKDSFEYGLKDLDGNKKFADLLLNNIEDFSGQVDLSFSLEGLKEVVSKKLNEIKFVIEKKNSEDKLHNEEIERKMDLLYSTLGKLKKEVYSAKKQADSYKKQALKDPLTKIYNRRAYDKKAKEEMERYLRYKNIFSMMLFDVDHFKKVNDIYGHDIGDKCLKEIIKRVKPGLRATDFLARFGGEEFIVLLPETSKKESAIVAEKIRKLVEKIEFFHKKERVSITISIGVTQVKNKDKSIDDIFKRLDNAMYKAKKNGRNRVVDL